jgi:hypothetical protein
MRRQSRFRRGLAAVVVGLSAATASVVAAPGASADPDIPINQSFDVTTRLATLGQEIQTTGGTLTGTLDLGTGELTGDLVMPATDTQLNLLGLGLANVGTRVVPTGPITGHVDLASSTITTSASFNLEITYVRLLGLPFLNLVGNRCRTSQPIMLETSGTIDLATQSGTMEGEFTIPPLENCGIGTSLLNPLVAGPGNTFTATATPAPAA